MTEVGRTKDVGYEIGVSKTLRAPLERVWAHLISPSGFGTWLGAGATLPAKPGDPYRADDGTTGELRSLHAGDRIRLTCRPAGWTHDTTVQLTVRSSPGNRTTLRLHQEALANADERVSQRGHWQGVMASLERAVTVR